MGDIRFPVCPNAVSGATVGRKRSTLENQRSQYSIVVFTSHYRGARRLSQSSPEITFVHAEHGAVRQSNIVMEDNKMASDRKQLKTAVSMPIISRPADQDHHLVQNRRNETEEDNGDGQTVKPKKPINKSLSNFHMDWNSSDNRQKD